MTEKYEILQDLCEAFDNFSESDFGSLYRGITVGDHFASSQKKVLHPSKKIH